jgi:DNA-binding MarR family transcriptional regulator
MKPETGSDVVDAMLYAAHRVRTTADTTLRDAGLSLSSYKLLKALSGADRSMRELSDVLHVSPRTITDMIDGLEGRELVRRCPHPSDRRMTVLKLTESGAQRLSGAAAAVEQTMATALDGLTPAEQERLRRLLDRVCPQPC